MTITAAEAALYRDLMSDGASPFEAAEVLLATREAGAIELASQAWRTERRGRGGEWTRTGVRVPSARTGNITSTADARRMQRMADANKAARQKQDIMADVRQVAHETAQDTATQVASKTDEANMARTIQHIATESAKLQAMSQEEHAKVARRKLAVRIGTLGAGAVLAAVEQHMGVPGALAAVSGMLPEVANELGAAKIETGGQKLAKVLSAPFHRTPPTGTG